MSSLISTQRRERGRALFMRAAFSLWSHTGRGPTARLFLNDVIARTNNFSTTSWLGVPIWQNTFDLWTALRS
jgi:cephalosporin hydroxylase